LICHLRIWRRVLFSYSNRELTLNKRAQCLQCFVYFLCVHHDVIRHKNDQESIKRRRKTYYFEKFQSASFFMKRLRKIHTTRRDRLVFRRRSSSSISSHAFVKHNYVRDSSNVQHYWFDLHVRRTAKRTRALHVKIKVKSIVKSYFNIY
jgi:hypothetical protein